MARGGGDPTEGGAGVDLRRAVRAEVEAHPPADPREAASKQQVLDALARLHRPFDEDAGPVHVTGSAVVVGPRGTVLHLHKRLHRWLQPGGHVDPGERPGDAALREAQEETGLSLAHPDDGPRLIHVDVHPAAKGHTHLDLRYLLLAPDRDPAPPPGESPAARWFSWDEACAIADEALAGALRVAMREPEVIGPVRHAAGAGDAADTPGAAVRTDAAEAGRAARQNGASDGPSVAHPS